MAEQPAPPDQAGALSYDADTDEYTTVTPPPDEAGPINDQPPPTVVTTSSGTLEVVTAKH